MSLTRLAVRIAAVHALRGATLAADRVFDSSTTPLDQTLQAEPMPFLMVTTDTHEREITGKDLSHGPERLELVIETGIASRARVQLGDGTDEEIISIPNTDAGMEMTLDLIETQVARALTSGLTEWSRVFGGLIVKFNSRLSRRGASAEDGLRYAARQIVLTCHALGDPIPGQAVAPNSAWANFLAAATADADLSHLVPVIRAMIEKPEQTSWGMIGEMLGVDQATVDAIGEAPMVLSAAGLPVDVAEIEAQMTGGPTWPITEAEADRQGV